MKAMITGKEKHWNVNHRKENGFTDEYTAFCITEDGEKKDLCILRIYWTQARAYACCWIYADNASYAGSGYAGGYGYHKPSAAAQEALEGAGVELSEDINGRGRDAMAAAVKAVGVAAVNDQCAVYVHHAHA